MKRSGLLANRFPRVIIAVIFFVILFHPVSAYGEFRAGIAVEDVTPDPLLPVSGGVGPSSPATKKLGQLTVRALVIENNGTCVAICTTDFLGFPGILCDRVRK